ncbi:hypothetical protein BKH42_08900 [Helicobacter sp. 13S00482-2]|uniref:hypothetical protein n=1 Tax=Helicobacter sp. 13S00482-2 TaxID=1476200 RepID=UPI000BA6780A|nr:hypothetical protein [Helicobacter sp. 13S00482-2]PAF52897.1 hypothetical protein BKH42_08900 [Helicobacter sp. 13S00482-2]
MKRMEILAERFKNVKRIIYLKDIIESEGAGDFIDTADFFRESFEDQVEDFDEFFEYVMFVILENGFEVGNPNSNEQVNKFPDGSIIDYNWDNQKKAKFIVSSWNRSLKMFPFETFSDPNYFILTYHLGLLSPCNAKKLKLKEIVVEEHADKKDEHQ